jgi:hypothetical protein
MAAPFPNYCQMNQSGEPFSRGSDVSAANLPVR